LSLCQGGPAWESHFQKVDLERKRLTKPS
jgi:hypothetical protein